MSSRIYEFGFSETALNEVRDTKHCKNWPVAYLLNNSKELYVGETTDMNRRAQEHFQNPERRRLKEMRVIDDDTFNKSVIYFSYVLLSGSSRIVKSPDVLPFAPILQ